MIKSIKTIKFRLPFSLFIIFFISFVLLNYLVNNMLEKNNEKIITNQLISLKKTSNVYVRQLFMINHLNNDEKCFKKIVKDMIEELNSVTESDISGYDTKGKYMYSSNKEKFMKVKGKDLENAVHGKTSYTIKYDNKNTEAYFSYPVVVSGRKVGILRFIKDYSSLYQQNQFVSKIVFYITIFVFIIAFILSYLLSRNISNPILKLAKASNEVAKGNLKIDIYSNRRDELGDLIRNFYKMVRKIEEQLKIIEKERDSLVQINKYREHFLDNVTHELKTPLTTIIGYSEMIKENEFTDIDFFRAGMNHITDESRRLHNMVLELLELSKNSTTVSNEFTRINIGKLLKNTCSDMQFKAKRYNNTIYCDIHDNIYINGDESKLKQVFINIIDNAIKYGYYGSLIKVETYVDNNFIEIKVKNKGEGIKKENLNNIFDPFYGSSKNGSTEIGSCGLGLSISKAIIDNHNGIIQIESEEKKETIVTIKLALTS